MAHFFDSAVDNGADVKMAANWIMGDIAAFLKSERLSIGEIKLTPGELAELISSIKGGTISGKMGKEVCLSWVPLVSGQKILFLNEHTWITRQSCRNHSFYFLNFVTCFCRFLSSSSPKEGRSNL